MARRKQPENPPPAVPHWQATRTTGAEHGRSIHVQKIGASEVVVQTRMYRLITPLFGGGVVAGVNDPDNLIRPTGIRGQLRFWWRATHGWQYGKDLNAMKSREDQIWGTANLTSHEPEETTASKPGYKTVHMMVEVIDGGDSVKPFVKGDKRAQKIPDYAAFPLRPDDKTVNNVHTDVTFLLTLIFAREVWQEVQDTLWAWETFGGVGARTRRGFGALKLEEIDGQAVSNDYFPPARAQEAKNWLSRRIARYQSKESNQITGEVPHLSLSSITPIGLAYRDASKSWKVLIDKLQRFRQQRIDRTTGRYSLFGKSLWPEVTALRKRIYPERTIDATPDTFPRAAFGLPIVFHLPHDQEAGKPTITLQGPSKETERLASPLILKPIPCQDGQFLALAAILYGPDLPVDTLALHKEGQKWQIISKDQTLIQASELTALPEVLHGKTNVLHAFLEYLNT
jgi:CRISPR-associated protein Cmr1